MDTARSAPDDLRTPIVAATVASLPTALLGALWLARPASYPFGAADRVTVSVTHLIGHRTAGTLLILAALAGLAAAVAASAGGRRVAGAVAAAVALFFALVMADASLMSALGYALGLTGPVLVVGAVGLACARGRRTGWLAAAALSSALAVAVGVGFLDATTVARLGRAVLGAFADYGGRLLWGLGMAALAAVWAWIGYRLLRLDGRPAWTRPDRAARWGRPVTLAAALCPLPYAFLRMTWLTPWALNLEPGYDTPAVRMQGAMLGGAALVGSVLTLGLVRDWGAVVPGWVPGYGGRPVPPALAVVPGGLVALAACVASPGFLVNAVEGNGGAGEVALLLLVFPFPVWGPLLAAAVLAYRLRRA